MASAAANTASLSHTTHNWNSSSLLSQIVVKVLLWGLVVRKGRNGTNNVERSNNLCNYDCSTFLIIRSHFFHSSQTELGGLPTTHIWFGAADVGKIPTMMISLRQV